MPTDVIGEEQYLVQEPQAEYKSEFRDGRTVAMSGANLTHNIIAANLVRRFAEMLDQKPCTVVGSDMRVKVAAAHFYTYPDVSVFCGRGAFDLRDKHALVNPILIVEVLSDSTEAYDRGEKFEYYKKLPSLREYVLVSQKSPRVETFFRQESGEWRGQIVTAGSAELVLQSIDCRIAVHDIYHKVDFEG